MIPFRLLLPIGLALALSSCDVFRPDAPADTATQNYGAAGAYDNTAAANTGGYPAYNQPANSYGQPTAGYGAANNAAGGYSPPNYNQPYTQPADANPYATGGNSGSASGRTHTVAGGENLSKIARRYGVTTDALMRANNLTNPDFVRAGQTLTIP
jgi:LysM repeat protein